MSLSLLENQNVISSLSMEIENAFDRLLNQYSRPEFIESLREIKKIETYINAKLLKYDPAYVKRLTEELI